VWVAWLHDLLVDLFNPRKPGGVYTIRSRSLRNVTDAAEQVPLDEDSYYQDPQGFFARLRKSRPVAPVRMPAYGRAWVVTRYEHVRAVLTDPRMAKDVRRWPGGGRSRPSEATGVYAHMLHADPPDHTRLRRLVQKPFASRQAALRPRAEEIAAGLLDEMARRGDDVIDLLGQYARPLPITVICELLGVPVADREWVRVTVYAYDERTEHARVERELAAYFTELIAAKRAEPGDDLVSELVIASDNANADGAADGLTRNELVSAAFLLVMAGFDTTVNLIASGTLALLTHPEEMARLRQDPSLLPAAVEELLRFTSPVNHANDRFTIEDVPIGDVVIPAGEWVIPAIASADWPGSPTRTAWTSAAIPAAMSPSVTACTTAWALRWPGWRPRSPSVPCSPASRESHSRSPRRNSAGVPSA
jgi:cytochrome P450